MKRDMGVLKDIVQTAHHAQLHIIKRCTTIPWV